MVQRGQRSERLLESLQQAGLHATAVHAANRAGYQKALAQRGPDVRGVLFLTGVDHGSDANHEATALREPAGAHAGASGGERAPVRHHAQRAAGGRADGPRAPEPSPAPRLRALEHPACYGGIIDVDGLTRAEAILCELLHSDGEDMVALRNQGDRRYVPRLRASAPVPRAAFKASAAWWCLVTGGLGSLGLAVAAWLASRGAKKIALMGRSAMPTSGPAAKAVAALRAQVEVRRHLRADVSDYKAVAAAVAQLDLLRGVVHCAGVISFAALKDMRRAPACAPRCRARTTCT